MDSKADLLRLTWPIILKMCQKNSNLMFATFIPKYKIEHLFSNIYLDIFQADCSEFQPLDGQIFV